MRPRVGASAAGSSRHEQRVLCHSFRRKRSLLCTLEANPMDARMAQAHETPGTITNSIWRIRGAADPIYSPRALRAALLLPSSLSRASSPAILQRWPPSGTIRSCPLCPSSMRTRSARRRATSSAPPSSLPRSRRSTTRMCAYLPPRALHPVADFPSHLSTRPFPIMPDVPEETHQLTFRCVKASIMASRPR